MSRRFPQLLLLLAVGAVCLLLWDAVLAPALKGASEEGEDAAYDASYLGGSAAGPHRAPSLTGAGGRRPGGLTAEAAAAERARLAAEAARSLVAGAALVLFEGRVVDRNGRPGSDVKILLVGAGGTQTVLTDANGHFKHAARPGRYTLLFQGGEAGGLLVRSHMLDGGNGEDLEFALREPAAIQIEVKRGDEAVPGTAINVVSRDVGELAAYEGITDMDGLVRFEGLVPGRYGVEAQVPEGPLVKLNTFATAAAQREVKFRVPDGVMFQGVVRAGQDGPGIAGATLTLETRPRKSQGIFETVFETSADGSFELMVPQGYPQRFSVEADGHAPWPTQRERKRVIKSLRGLMKKNPVTRNVTLKGGAVLSGVVATEEKQPLPGIVLRFLMRRAPTVSVTTKEDGSYAVANLNPGRYELQVETANYFPVDGQALRISIPGGATPRPQVLDVILVGARRLDGIVVDAAGSGVAGARVFIVGGGRVVRSARNAGRELEVFTDANGRWEISDIPPDKNVVVRAVMGSLEADPVFARFDRPPPLPIRMQLKATGLIRGTAVDIDTRTHVRGVRIRLQPTPANGRTARSALTNAEGEFTVEGLLPGTWALTPTKSGYLVGEAEPVELSRGGEVTTIVRLDPGRIFAGTVVDEAGTPQRWVRIFVSGLPDGKDKTVRRNATTNAQGVFRLTGFYSGIYTVRASRKGLRTEYARDLRQGDSNLRFVMRRVVKR